jgi:hypothetical protein
MTREIGPPASGSTRRERDRFSLTGDTMVNAMDRVAPSLRGLFKAG